MTLRLHDTATRSLRPLDPLTPGHVGIFVCGASLYALPHVGHLRSAVVLDVLHRWLRASDLQVTLVRPVVDVDDLVVHDASHDDEPWWALSTRNARAFAQAYDAVQVLPPTAEPRTSGSTAAVVALAERLLADGRAYASDGDVFLSVRSGQDYGSLSRQKPDQLKAPERAVAHGHTGTRRDPLDATLWKALRDLGPGWPSPWGSGRPGTHVDCATSAAEHLGQTYDVHAGSVDQLFPHHENERALAGGAARHWLHHGLVTGAPPRVDEVLQTVRPQVLRYALGAGHYRSAMEWSAQSVGDADAAYGRIETFVRNATALVAPAGPTTVEPGASSADWAAFAAALDDDLGVPQALGVVHAGVRAGNALLAARDLPALAATLSDVRRMLSVLALDPVEQWPATGGGELSGVVDALVALAVEARADARARKDWGQADAVRDRLNASGIVLEDTSDGVRWRLA